MFGETRNIFSYSSREEKKNLSFQSFLFELEENLSRLKMSFGVLLHFLYFVEEDCHFIFFLFDFEKNSENNQEIMSCKETNETGN